MTTTFMDRRQVLKGAGVNGGHTWIVINPVEAQSSASH